MSVTTTVPTFRVFERVTRHVDLMAGWEANAHVDCSEPETTIDVRPLNGDNAWVDYELTNGVAGVYVTIFGDGPGDAHIKANGADRAAVIAAVRNAATSILAGVGRGWFE